MKIPTEAFVLNQEESIFLDFEKRRKEVLARMFTFHNVECDAYELLKGIKDFPLAEIYYLQKANEHKNGIIMMADLSDRCTTLGTFRSITSEYCFQAAKHIADFQAYIECLDNDNWREKFQKSINTQLKDSQRKCLSLAQEYNNGGMFVQYRLNSFKFRAKRSNSILSRR
jgi:hypothetical protein